MEEIKKHEEKLKDAGLTTPEERRRKGDMGEAFKTIRGLNNVERDEWFEFPKQMNVCTRSKAVIGTDGEERRSEAVVRQRARLDVRANCFRMRAGKRWNDLPDELKASKSVYAFRNAYDAWINQSPHEQRRD